MNLFFTLILTKRDYQATSVQFSSGTFESLSGLSQPQPYRQTANSHVYSSPISSSTSEEEDAGENEPGEQSQQRVTLALRTVYTHIYRGKKDNEASHINDVFSPLSFFLLYFAEFITLLVVETKRYYPVYIDRFDDGPSPEPDVTETDMFVFLALTIQLEHDVRDKLTDYWETVDQL